MSSNATNNLVVGPHIKSTTPIQAPANIYRKGMSSNATENQVVGLLIKSTTPIQVPSKVPCICYHPHYCLRYYSGALFRTVGRFDLSIFSSLLQT